jgi:hypothetical protein
MVIHSNSTAEPTARFGSGRIKDAETMIASLLAALFAGTATLALGVIFFGWKTYGHRFRELREELRTASEPVTVRYAWRETAATGSATVYNLDFKAKADCLPFHPELGRELPVAA